MTYTDEDVARVVHEANRALQEIHGDECPSPPWKTWLLTRRPWRTR